MSRIDKTKFERCFYYFQSYVEMYSGEHFDGFDNYFLENEEGYKYKVFEVAHNSLKPDSWKREHIGTGYIARCFEAAYKKKDNLVNRFMDDIIETQIEENLEEVETFLYKLYTTDEDAVSFERAIDIFGAKYGLIAYLFFIKDKDRYLPISPENFEEAFEMLGIDIKLQRNCSWENYAEFLSLIALIREEFRNHCGIEITLLDAHSFVWMIGQAKHHFITKEIWHSILKNGDLVKLHDIELITHFYNAPEHKAACSEISQKTGVPVSTYNLLLGKAGKRVADHLRFKDNIREEGGERGWSVFFRGHYREDRLFEWQVKPELVEALEMLIPDLRLNDSAIDAIKKDGATLVSELEADNEEQLQIGSSDVVVKSDFTEFVGIPREKPQLVETRHGKRYKRDRQRAVNALHRANYVCEYNPTHETFLRKGIDINYTESHHLVPMAFQDLFDVTLDTEANIVSLCSNCHNHIHYGQGTEMLVEELYNQRKDALEKEGIAISLEKLLAMYK